MLSALPRSVASLIWNLTYSVAWTTLPLSFLNTVGDLGIVARGVRWAYGRVEALRPFLDSAAPVIGIVLNFWRRITEPFHAWLGQLLPFAVPVHVADLLIVVVFVAPSIFRVLAAQRDYADAADRNFQARMHERGEVDDEGRLYEPALIATGRESKWNRRMRLRAAILLVGVAVALGAVAATLIGLDWFYS